jgi:hypothetical protein
MDDDDGNCWDNAPTESHFNKGGMSATRWKVKFDGHLIS